MEMTWFWFAFLHWTLASVNLCINRATKNLHAQMMMTVWELLLRLQEILQILSVAQAHVRLEMGGVRQQIKASLTYTNLNASSLAIWPSSPHAKMRRIVALWWISRNFQLCMNYQCGRFEQVSWLHTSCVLGMGGARESKHRQCLSCCPHTRIIG